VGGLQWVALSLSTQEDKTGRTLVKESADKTARAAAFKELHEAIKNLQSHIAEYNCNPCQIVAGQIKLIAFKAENAERKSA
jgi:hypothetical protein